MLARNKGEIPFAIYLLPFLTGICLALNFRPDTYSGFLSVSFFVFLGLFVALNIGYSTLKVYRNAWLGGVLLHVLFFLMGFMLTLSNNNQRHSNYFEKQKADALLITINNEPQFKNGYLRFTAKVSETTLGGKRKPASGKILITLPADTGTARQYAYGDILLITNKAEPVNPPFNPGEFNYKQYLAHQNIYAQAFLNPGDVIMLTHNAENLLVGYALRLRAKLVEKFQQNMQSAEAVAVASTLILGYKADLGDDVIAAYSHTGTIHILSVSGGHVIILFTLIGWMLGFMDSWRYGRFLKAGLIVLLIGYYALLTGLSPAACRAAAMVALLIVGKAFYRQAHTLNLLAASALIQLLIDPFLLADVGFQLSYLAVAGLVIFQPIIYRLLDIDNRWLDWVWKFCSASVAAQAITFPLAAYYFHQFPVYFLISNLFILPLAEVIMFLGLAFLLLAQAGIASLSHFLGKLLEFFILLMDNGLRRIEHWPYAYVDKIWISRLECLLLSAVVVFLFAWLYYRSGLLLGWAVIFLLFFSGLFNVSAVKTMQTNNVTFLNLKRHTGIIFKNGDRAVLVTDVNDTDKVYRYSIKPGLDSSGIRHLIKCSPNANVTAPWLVKRGNLMRFAGGNVLLIDSMLPRPGRLVKANYLLIAQGNFHIAKPLVESANYKHVIIGAGITPKNTIAITKHASATGKKIFLQRRNYCLIFKSD